MDGDTFHEGNRLRVVHPPWPDYAQRSDRFAKSVGSFHYGISATESRAFTGLSADKDDCPARFAYETIHVKEVNDHVVVFKEFKHLDDLLRFIELGLSDET